MGSIVLTTLSVFLGLFFIFVGSMKLTPSINRDMHREIRLFKQKPFFQCQLPLRSLSLNRILKDLYKDDDASLYQRRNFVQYAKVFPFAKPLGYKIPSKIYRITVGWTEVVCGTILVIIPGMVKQIANVVLLIMMSGAFYTHTIMDDKFERTAPSIVFALMLACRLVVFFQVRRKEQRLAKLQASKAAAANVGESSQNKDTKQD